MAAESNTEAVKSEIGSFFEAFPDGMIFVHDLDRFLSLDEEQALAEALKRVATTIKRA